MASTFEDLDKARAPNAAPATFEQLDAAQAPKKPTLGQEISGALSTFTRAVPGLDEVNDGAYALGKTALDLATGKSPTDSKAFQDNLTAARARSKASADDFTARHPIVGNLTKGVGMIAPAVAAIATGGGSLLPEAGAITEAASPAATGLMGALKTATAPVGRIASVAAKGGTVGGLTAALSGLLDDGTLDERFQHMDDAIPAGVGFGAALPIGASALGKVINAGARAFAPTAEKEAATAGRILAARAPEATSSPTFIANDTPAPTDGLLPFERMGGGGKSLARAVAAVPGPGKDIAERALSARQAQAPARMLGSTTAALGDDGSNFHPTLEALDKQRLTESGPMFKDAFDQEPTTSDRLQDLTRRPSIQDAIKRAFRLSMEEGKSPQGLTLFNMEEPDGWVSEAPPTGATVDQAQKVAARGGPSKVSQGQSLVKFIADGGGIRDPQGEIGAMDGQAWNRGKPFQRRLIGEGADPDTWALRAWEQGYFPEHSTRPTQNHLFDAIGQELRGKPRFARQADQGALDRINGRDQAEELAYRGGDPADLPTPEQYTGRPEPQTGPVMGEVPTPEAWHYVKRGLDDLIESKRDPVTGKLPRTDEMRTMDQTRRSLRGELTSLNPQYGEALKTYAGPSRQIDAMQLGRRLASGKIDPEDISARAATMSADEQDALRLGVSRGLADQFRSGNPQAAFRRFANDGVAQDRLRAGFGNDAAYSGFMNDIEAEVRAQKSHNDILAGSRTTPLREDIDAANDAAGSNPAVDAFVRRAQGQGFRSQAVGALLRNWARVRQPGLNNPEVSRMLGEALFQSGDPHRLLNAMVAEKVVTPDEVQAVLPYLAAGAGEISGEKRAMP